MHRKRQKVNLINGKASERERETLELHNFLSSYQDDESRGCITEPKSEENVQLIRIWVKSESISRRAGHAS